MDAPPNGRCHTPPWLRAGKPDFSAARARMARAWALKEASLRLAWAALASRMVRKHLNGILNGKIQWIQAMACGYRNRERFRNAILFHVGALDLYPRPASAHTTSGSTSLKSTLSRIDSPRIVSNIRVP